MILARRSFLTAASLSALPRAAWAQNLSAGVFTHGVASGDPVSDGVILWTRFAHSGEGRLAWEIAEDEAFTRMVGRGDTSASFANDFCAKVDVRGLAPERHYFYRFLSASGPSPTGQTMTAPREGGERLTVAVFSCSNFPFGYFHAYGHAAQRADIDLVLHTGDYIYEYGRGIYPSEADAVPGRLIDPVRETVTLQDYYQRYALYHTDPDLQELRRLKPLSAVWDDHELTNNTWRDGAQNHQDYEGDFAQRMAAAAKAYFDWMPIRRPAPSGLRLYRHLDWGDLARIILLDARLIGRDQQLDYRAVLTGPAAEGPAAASAAIAEFRHTTLDNANRTLLGAAQEAWLADTLVQSKQRGQRWQIITQQMVVADQYFPQGMSALLSDGASANTRRWVAAGETIGALGLGWNLDAWSGYPAARTRLLEACAVAASNAVILGGDSHNCWLNNLPAPNGGRLAAIEFAGGSVTSPGFERTFSNTGEGEREALMRSGNPQLAWCDVSRRGYGVLRFTREGCRAEWNAFDDVRRPEPGNVHAHVIESAASESAGPGPWTAAVP